MAQQSAQQRNVTLVREIHDHPPTHLAGIENLVREKLKTKDVIVILGLEDDNIHTLTIDAQPVLRRGQKTSSQQIEEFKTIHHRQEYKEMFERLLSDIPPNKKIIVVGIDDAELAASKDSISLGTRRDRAMKAKIEAACDIHGASELICAIVQLIYLTLPIKDKIKENVWG
ncbi:MAG: hypothetical protein RLZZ59_535 [Pseudomonadota bacterium]|jgi:hypothetical protein